MSFKERSDSQVEGKVQAEKTHYFQVAKRILNLNKSEWLSMTVATLAAVFIGASFPIFAILFAEFYGVHILSKKKRIS